jgi:cytochrome c peroxidase
MSVPGRSRRSFALAAVLGAVLLAAPAAGGPHAGAALGLPPVAAPDPARVALGRALFFDRNLSVNNTLSCGMCHVPSQGFSVNQTRTAVGMEGVSLRRNAPTLLNVAHVRAPFVDGRASGLEQQALQPFTHPEEMANPDLASVLRRIHATPRLRPLIERAYGRGERLDATRLAQSLADFQRSLVAAGAPFDRWRYAGEAGAIGALEQRGLAAFVARGCSACHTIGEHDALFSDGAFHNTGVAAASRRRAQQPVTAELVPGLHATLTPAELQRIGDPDRPDEGRFEVSGRAADRRAFRTPTLRNVELTAPYMHDGSLATLDAVLDFYAGGGSPADPAQDRRIRPFDYGPGERDALLAFLRSLTSPAARRLASDGP